MAAEHQDQNQQDKCCKQCPFAKSTTKEYLDTMGQNGERFIGQSVGPYHLPCHMRKEFDDFGRRFDEGEPTPGCAGAAKYRANLGVAHLLPHELGMLPPDFKNVFGSHAELLAHHEGTTLEEAGEKLAEKSPMQMLVDEAYSPTARFRKR